MKSLYNVSKVCNHWFTTYYIYYKNNLEIKKSIYDSFFLYNFGLFDIVKMQTNNTLIFANNNFVNIKKAVIKAIKIMTKNCKHFTFLQFLKLNRVQIKLNSERIILTKKSYVSGILLVTNYIADSISLKRITRTKLLPKK